MSWLEEVITKLGVQEFCICAGKRNVALVQAIRKLPGVTCYQHFDERSAAFFALGLARANDRAVAVVTTSGTAVGELLPAIMEAHHTNTPLIALTADRPKSFRGTGAPQACEQKDIFGSYAKCIDLDEGDVYEGSWDRHSPIQVNVCISEPNEPQVSSLKVLEGNYQQRLNEFLEGAKKPLVLVGTLKQSERASVFNFLKNLGVAIYLEAPSGLREHPQLQHLSIRNPEHFYPDAVLKLGGVPTTRYWRDIGNTPLISISETRYCGAPNGEHYVADLSTLPEVRLNMDFSGFKERDDAVSKDLVQLLENEPLSEPGIFHTLSKMIAPGESLYLGNSMPIREWDLAADLSATSSVFASRGVNGIDGQISTALGLGADWIILGDLTALYDLQGLWVLGQLKKNFRLVVINNSGGKIFKRVGLGDEFINPHNLNFEAAAKLWGLEYTLWNGGEIPYGLIEIVPDEEATERFWNEKNHLSSRFSRQTL